MAQTAMSHTFSAIYSHVIFSTTDRYPFITPDLRDRLYGFAGGVVRNLGGHTIATGGVADHIHFLIRTPPSLTLSDVVGKVKANSSRWIHDTFPQLPGKFSWQAGFGVFSVSRSNVDGVVEYIRTQEQHHRTRSFQEEFIAFLDKHDVEYDKRFIWR